MPKNPKGGRPPVGPGRSICWDNESWERAAEAAAVYKMNRSEFIRTIVNREADRVLGPPNPRGPQNGGIRR